MSHFEDNLMELMFEKKFLKMLLFDLANYT